MLAGVEVTSRPVCPSVARVITASVIVPMAPVVQAWSAPLDGIIPGQSIDSDNNAAPSGTKK